MHQEPMRVILGACSLKAYVTAPKTMHVLGIVRIGQEYGLLANDAAGTFFRVNGSRTDALDTFSVNSAIDVAHCNGVRAGLAPAGDYAEFADSAPAAIARQVTIRKHRHAESRAHA